MLRQIAVLPVLFLILPIVATGAIIHVPGDQPTIQAGIDAAVDGDTVLVGPGNHVENIDFLGKSVTVASEDGPATTVIDGGAAGSVVTFAGGETRDAQLQGFTITNGSGTEVGGDWIGGGILCRQHSSPTISGNIISSNIAINDGGGIACIESSSPLITGNTIQVNAAANGSGVSCRHSSPQISDNTISYNHASFGGGILVSGQDSFPQVALNTISDNEASFSGGGVMCVDYSAPTLAENIIRSNESAQEGGGIDCAGYCTPLITGNLITENRAGFGPSYGGAGIVVWYYAFATITGNTVGNNESGFEGGGIWIEDTGFALISGNTIVGNSANSDRGGGICFSIAQTVSFPCPGTEDDQAASGSPRAMGFVYDAAGNPSPKTAGGQRAGTVRSVVNNLVRGNRSRYDGGIHRSNAGTVPIINNTIIGNTAISSSSPGGIGGVPGPTIRNNIIRGNSPMQIGEGIVATYCDVEGGWPGTGNIDADPLFVSGPLGEQYLSQIAAGQPTDSPCVDAGRPDSDMIAGTTRTDGMQDGGVVDMGFHYPLTDGVYICAQPGLFEFETSFPGGDPSPQNLTIWSCGTGILEWSVSSEADWLILEPRSGYSEGELDLVTVGIEMGAVAPGEYEAIIRILGIGALNSPQEIPVSLVVNDARNRRLVIGPGPGFDNPPLVRIFRPLAGATHVHEFTAYGVPHFGVNVSAGDVDGDIIAEVLTGAGPGAVFGPHVRGFEENGTPLPGLNFLAYGTNRYGVNVCAGDLDSDGFDEIITGAGPGAVFGPHVRGWDYDGTGEVSPLPGVNFFAYGTPKWGVNVSAGDIDGDGFDEIVTGPGPGAVYGPHVRGWNVDGGTATAMPGCSFFAYGTLKFGVNVSCGDVDGDGIDEIVTASGPSPMFGAHIRGFEMDGTQLPGLSFFAWDPSEVRYGANVFAGADLNSGGRDEIVVGCGPDPDAGTEVKVFEYDGTEVILWFSLEAFEGMSYGINVAAGRF